MNWKEPKVYAVKHIDEKIRMNSRSGGFFTAISDAILEQNGIVYGCILTETFSAIHYRADNKIDRDKMRGSKYVQSELGDTFKNVLEDLNKGRKVLFTGTSCQVSGLKSFLKQDFDNLICVDILCHGVPSAKVWNDYIKWQSNRNKGICEKIDFRNKNDFGWAAHVESIFVKRKNKTKQINSTVFKTLFLKNLILRPSCYVCPYKKTMHPSDITIADYWGITKVAPEFNDNKGVSLVLINNDLGMNIFNDISLKLNYIETSINDCMQPALYSPSERPVNRDEFWKDYFSKPFDKIASEYGDFNIVKRLKEKIRIVLQRK